MKRLYLSLALVTLAGCTTFPELDGTVPAHLEQAGYPQLVPVEPLLARAETIQITDQTEAGISARVAALRARAARLRGTIVDQPTRARLKGGVQLPPQNNG
ncbi:hypothetical protein U5922_010385 [Aquicoccus sp. G2-2]|uniref:hypothetical protein n=1 Tax=Aquicoccus sp. G2-2 TaxID=3092120 RepID=UPI002ADF40D9|nr:hypothetical protein [Aquicoccus sp. G2-2]MEA1113858.1 hypothetical protein [Aquicoccus sp. G2-2]